MPPNRNGLRRMTASQMIQMYETDLAALADEIPAHVKTIVDINNAAVDFAAISINPTSEMTLNRALILNALVRLADYFLQHPTLTRVDPVIHATEKYMVEAASIILYSIRDHPDLAYFGSIQERHNVLEGIARLAEYLKREQVFDQTVDEAEKRIKELVLKSVLKLRGHPAAGQVALTSEMLKFAEQTEEGINRASGMEEHRSDSAMDTDDEMHM